MKSSKEFFEKLSNDEAFAKEVGNAIQARREAGAEDYYETIIPVAEELGYEISKDELDSIIEERSSVLSEEELGKVSGGVSCFPLTFLVSVLITTSSVVTSLYTTSD